MTKIVYFGTHEFGAAMLKSLLEGGFEVKTVVTQPDRPVGRDKILKESAVKILAKKHDLPVLQPENLKGFELSEGQDLNIVCQYGLIIPRGIFDSPARGSINVHTSLLPKYRGPSPIQSAIMNGENETGVTIMLMDEKMDHGPILAQEKVTIGRDEKYLDLQTRMEEVAGPLLVKTLKAWLDGKIEPKIQDEKEASFCKMFSRDDGKVNWSRSSLEIYNQFRGLTPWPGIWTTWKSKRIKLLSIKPASQKLEPGKVVFINDTIFIGTENGSIEATELQLEGKRVMSSKEFVVGNRDFSGSTLGI